MRYIIVKIGVCVNHPGDWKLVAENGYDYIETTFQSVINATDAEFEVMKKAREDSGIKVEACMCYFPGTMNLYAYDPETGEATEDFAEVEKTVREYSERGFSRAADLGLKVAVIGSGAARNIPDGMKREVAEKQFARVLGICGEVAAKYGAIIAIEPLNRGETNFINTLEEGLRICEMAKSDSVFVLNDFFHSMKENESTDWLAKAGKRLRHVHIASAERVCPTLEKDGEYLLPLVKALVDTGYDERISYECALHPDVATAIKNARSLSDEFRVLRTKLALTGKQKNEVCPSGKQKNEVCPSGK